MLTIEVVKEVLHRLGIPYEEFDDKLIMPTVCHNPLNSANNYKLYWYADSGLFHCYTQCSCSFNLYQFLKKFFEVNDIQKTNREINEYIGSHEPVVVDDGLLDVLAKYRKPYTITEIAPEILEMFTFYNPSEWSNEGIEDEVLKRFNIKYFFDFNGMVIPHYNIRGALIGVRIRHFDNIDGGKYRPLQLGDTSYAHPLSLSPYGIYEADIEDKVLIFEGEKSVLKAWQWDYPSVACCGSNISNGHIFNLLKKGASEIIIALDKEHTESTVEKQFDKFYNLCKKYEPLCNMSFIFDLTNKLDLKDAPVDKGREIFEELVEKRICIW